MTKDRLIKIFTELIKFDTQSSEEANRFPSTESQELFAEMLAGKLSTMGIDDVTVDRNGYVIATIPANTEKKTDTIGFIAHIDTSPEYSGKNIMPNIIENYNGEDIKLKNNITISKNEFKELENHIGQTIITADGNTLLGADDKAGVSEILAATEYLINHNEIKHGEIKIAFTPDEEIGKGMDKFNVENFKCDYAYTMDGDEEGTLNYENFNAAGGKISVKGKNVHPGYAKGIMINANRVVTDYVEELLKFGIPEETEGYEGFVYLTKISGTSEECNAEYIIRSFDKAELEKEIQREKKIIEKNIKEKYPKAEIALEIKYQYENMKSVFDGKEYIIEKAKRAIEKTGLKAQILPIRGGTDGARLSFMGVPCPNIFTGGQNFHGPYEYVAVESMVKATQVIINIASDI